MIERPSEVPITCSILRDLRAESPRVVVIEHGRSTDRSFARPVWRQTVRFMVDRSVDRTVDQLVAHAEACARDWARSEGLTVVDFERRSIQADESASLVVQGTLTDGRAAALDLDLHHPERGASPGFLHLHVEDPAGIECPFLRGARCDECWMRGHASVLIASEVFEAHGNPRSGVDQPDLLWHALAGILHLWCRDLPPRDVSGAPRAVSERDDTAVRSIADLIGKYGARGRGIQMLVQRAIDLVPSWQGEADLKERIGIAMDDLASALDAQTSTQS